MTHLSPYPEGGSGVPVSPNSAFHAVWSSADELVYRDPVRGTMLAVKLVTDGGAVRFEPPRELFEDTYFFRQVGPKDYDLTPDGRFLMIKEGYVTAPGQITVVRNWVEELKERVAVP